MPSGVGTPALNAGFCLKCPLVEQWLSDLYKVVFLGFTPPLYLPPPKLLGPLSLMQIQIGIVLTSHLLWKFLETVWGTTRSGPSLTIET